MSKLRLAVAAAFLALLAGCPTEADDLRRSRFEALDPPQPEVAEKEFACTNLRKWRADLDTPQYLNEAAPGASPDDESKRTRLLKDYQKDHEGTLITCRNKLGADGTCSVCTEMMNSPKFLEQVYDADKSAASHDYTTRAIQLADNQKIATKFTCRLEYSKSDYDTDAAAQEQSFRAWLNGRGADSAYVDKAVELEKAKGAWSTATAPKSVLKYGLGPLAEKFVTCPNKDCKTRSTTSVGLSESRCWNCSTYFAWTVRDTRMSESEPLETLCPYCKTPVDPTSNFCMKCSKFHRTADREGPCWRCGGTGVCPECNGSGRGTAPIYNGNEDCYLCGGKLPGGTNGLCPECGNDKVRGFVIYDGALPVTYNASKRANDDWKLSKNGAPAPAGKKPVDEAPKKPAGGDEGEGDK